jgi:undecaprenyl phosphate-alpha-L-ara4FN deformylase
MPTLDELVGIGGVTEGNVAAHLLEHTRDALPAPAGHVFTLHAELEGMRLAPAFEQLLLGWKAQGWSLGPTRALYDAVEPMALPRCTVGNGTVAGRSGTLLVQGPEFLGEVDLAEAA